MQRLAATLDSHGGFQKVLAFRPTGWSFASSTAKRQGASPPTAGSAATVAAAHKQPRVPPASAAAAHAFKGSAYSATGAHTLFSDAVASHPAAAETSQSFKHSEAFGACQHATLSSSASIASSQCSLHVSGFHTMIHGIPAGHPIRQQEPVNLRKRKGVNHESANEQPCKSLCHTPCVPYREVRQRGPEDTAEDASEQPGAHCVDVVNIGIKVPAPVDTARVLCHSPCEPAQDEDVENIAPSATEKQTGPPEALGGSAKAPMHGKCGARAELLSESPPDAFAVLMHGQHPAKASERPTDAFAALMHGAQKRARRAREGREADDVYVPWLDPPKTNCSGRIRIFSVPYSEHSSFAELCEFVQWFRPVAVVPTVNCGSAGQKVPAMLHALATGPLRL
jgi:hypothetical protein